MMCGCVSLHMFPSTAHFFLIQTLSHILSFKSGRLRCYLKSVVLISHGVTPTTPKLHETSFPWLLHCLKEQNIYHSTF